MSIYNKAWLVEQSEKKERIQYLFFWGHRPSADGSVTASCFSQWWAQSFVHEDQSYPTAEHWMMAQKALLFRDSEMLEKILLAPSPAEAKKFGRMVTGFDPVLWQQQRFEIVVQGNCHKFGQHPELKEFLLQTGSQVLVEASPRDQIWGIGMGAQNPKAENPLLWRGHNLLGFALMEVRYRLNIGLL